MFRRCLILGGKGFIGSHLVEALLSIGMHVRVFDKFDVHSLIPAELLNQIEMVNGDFTNSENLAIALEGCDLCFHLISTTLPKTSNDAPGRDLHSNVLSTINFLEEARRMGLKKIVFLSSGGTVYGIPKYLPIDELHPTDPICSYGITKLAIEKYLELYRLLYGIDYVVLRVSNAYGERQRLIAVHGAAAVFLGKALSGDKISIWGDGSIARDCIYVGDVMRALTAAINYSGRECIFNIGSGVPTTMLELITAVESVVGKKVDVEFMPARPFDVPINVLDVHRAKCELDWIPKVSLQDGLLRMRNWVTK